MRIAFSHNLRLTDSEEEAEFDSAETVQAIADGLRAGGHEVETIEVTGPASHLAARLESFGPDLIFNTAEGRRGRTREAFYPSLFEELGFPYTGSDAYVLTVTLDKWLTKLVLGQKGIDTPRGRLVHSEGHGPQEPPRQPHLVLHLPGALPRHCRAAAADRVPQDEDACCQLLHQGVHLGNLRELPPEALHAQLRRPVDVFQVGDAVNLQSKEE